MKFHALYWWIDRWRKSTAYTDLTLEEQGAYRNLLDEATLRGGPLPDDQRVLAKACGDATRWARIRQNVMKRFHKTADGWRNETLDRVLQETQRRADRQRAYRATTRSPILRDVDRQARERARGATRRALADGRLVRQPCEECGAPAQAHHDDYSKPLNVRWLCPQHHAAWHHTAAGQTSGQTSGQTPGERPRRSGSGS